MVTSVCFGPTPSLLKETIGMLQREQDVKYSVTTIALESFALL